MRGGGYTSFVAGGGVCNVCVDIISIAVPLLEFFIHGGAT